MFETVTRECFEEIRVIEKDSKMKIVDVDNILSFNDVDFCHQIDTICPVLSAALKGSLGSIHTDTHEAKVCRTTLYGAIFKIRYVGLFILNWTGLE